MCKENHNNALHGEVPLALQRAQCALAKRQLQLEAKANLWRNLPNHGVIAAVWDFEDDEKKIVIVLSYDQATDMFTDTYGYDWRFARKLTKEEVAMFLMHAPVVNEVVE